MKLWNRSTICLRSPMFSAARRRDCRRPRAASLPVCGRISIFSTRSTAMVLTAPPAAVTRYTSPNRLMSPSILVPSLRVITSAPATQGSAATPKPAARVVSWSNSPQARTAMRWAQSPPGQLTVARAAWPDHRHGRTRQDRDATNIERPSGHIVAGIHSVWISLTSSSSPLLH